MLRANESIHMILCLYGCKMAVAPDAYHLSSLLLVIRCDMSVAAKAKQMRAAMQSDSSASAVDVQSCCST